MSLLKSKAQTFSICSMNGISEANHETWSYCCEGAGSACMSTLFPLADERS